MIWPLEMEMKPSPWSIKIVTLLTAIALSGLPAMAQATAPAQNQQAPAQDTVNGTVDPSAGPKTPVPSSDLPEAPQPSEQAAPVAPAPPQSSSSQPQQQKPEQPLGTAAAQRGNTAGGPASEPAGMAIAPAKQKQTRSLLIKIGAVAAAGVALGLVYGLTHATPSTPPNAGAATK